MQGADNSLLSTRRDEQGFPFTGGESTGVGAGPAVNAGAGMPGAGGEDVGFGVPHSHKTTPGGGVAAQGY